MNTVLPGTPARPGPIVLFGSGETSPSGRKIFDLVLHRMGLHGPRIALLETPAGFELNSSQVIGRVADFIQHRLQNYNPEVAVIAARRREILESPDNPDIIAPLLQSDLIFMGPGSPTYAVRQLRNSLAWYYLMARHRLGAAIALASAATIAVSAYALPVYEIYKVGEDLHWKKGLDLFGAYGLPLVFIPHWNNQDGGEELDTSRCFMGQERFARLMEMLPVDLTVLGIDEKTALVMDVESGICHVAGLGSVTLIHTGHEHQISARDGDLHGTGLAEVAEQREGHVHIFSTGSTFPLSECCPFEIPPAGTGLPAEVWKKALEANSQVKKLADPNETAGPSPEVLALQEQRREARARKDWAASDELRDQISALGWEVRDTPSGSQLVKI